MSLEDYEALEETAYLLRSPKNTRRLIESIAQLENDKDVNLVYDSKSQVLCFSLLTPDLTRHAIPGKKLRPKKQEYLKSLNEFS
jgi:hypothetical protein